MNREPVLTTATAVAAVAAVIALLVAFGVDVTQDQEAAILRVVAVFGPVVAALLARRKVTPVAAPKDDAGNALVPASLG